MEKAVVPAPAWHCLISWGKVSFEGFAGVVQKIPLLAHFLGKPGFCQKIAA